MSDGASDPGAERLVAEFRVAHPDFPLMETVETTPEFSIRSQFQPGTSTTAPEKFFVVEAPDFDAVEAAARADPSVSEVTNVGDFTDRRTYRVTFTESTFLLSPALVDLGIQIDEIDADGDTWRYRVFAADRPTMLAGLERARESCSRFTLDRLYSPLEDASAGLVDLTPARREALEAAYREGYFDVPRNTSLVDLGEQLGVSDSAMSTRLRRAVHDLVEQTVIVEDRD
ncbi:helix-turn-helix domain-containing protein [Halobacteriales archaeon Cl-PHB]